MRFCHRPAAFILLGLFILLTDLTTYGFQPSNPAGDLPPIDKRAGRNPEASPEKKAAIARLKTAVPGTQLSFNEKLGTPSWLGSPKSFLTGPQGVGKGVSQAQADRFGKDDPDRPIKAFLNEHAAVYGHGAEILNGARVKRQFVSRNNGVRTTVWEQQVDGIPIYESVLMGHVTANQELVNISSSFVPQPELAVRLANPNGGARQSLPGISVAEGIAIAAEALGVTVYVEEVMALDEAKGPEN